MLNYFKEQMSIIEKSLESLSEENFNDILNQAEACIKNGGKLVFSGLGKNVPICEKIVGTCTSLSIPAVFMHTNTAMHGDLGYIGKKDLVFVLSKSGNTAESILLANYLNQRGDRAIAVTFNKDSLLNKTLSTNLTLELEHEGDNWNIVPNASSSTYLLLLQGLALQLADRLGITLVDFKYNHPGGAIGSILKDVK